MQDKASLRDNEISFVLVRRYYGILFLIEIFHEQLTNPVAYCNNAKSVKIRLVVFTEP